MENKISSTNEYVSRINNCASEITSTISSIDQKIELLAEAGSRLSNVAQSLETDYLQDMFNNAKEMVSDVCARIELLKTEATSSLDEIANDIDNALLAINDAYAAYQIECIEEDKREMERLDAEEAAANDQLMDM